MVESRGFEPLSKNNFPKISTSLVSYIYSLIDTLTNKYNYKLSLRYSSYYLGE